MRRIPVLICLGLASVLAHGKENSALPDEISIKGMAMKLIPEGEFVMGSNKADTEGKQNEFGSVKPFYLDEHPKHTERTPAFYISEYEITNAQYRQFVASTKHQPPSDWISSGYIVSMKSEKLKQLSVVQLRKVAVDHFHIDVDTRNLNKEQLLDVINKYFKDLDKLPVHDVNWFDAEAFCEWDGGKLPTEAQWEKAARGDSGNEFPWGNDFEPGLSNTGDEEWPMGAAPVGSYKSDKSVFGIYDLAGNVTEWVFDWYQPYPNSNFKSEEYGKKYKVTRGAGWGGTGHYALQIYQRGAYRAYLTPDSQYEDLGFRCAAEANKATKHLAQSNH
ncbi:MAG: SUMF1/EgtB/PvdO family nonheme iron enzyme [Gammaproteobacteria bacterium]|nr:SUMF1/EgtB/PvdO family nonheme iron enzyme [Gammaproteobacteria bacterium]